jgi:hypothetical protein
MKKYVYDIEVHPNYILVGFMDIITKKKRQYEAFGEDESFTDFQIRKIKRIIKLYKLVGFNSNGYDDPILTYMLLGKSCLQVYKKSKKVIEDESVKKWNVYDSINIDKKFDSIDLMDVTPSQASLKLYGARLNSQKLQDLPYDPHENVTPQQAAEVKKYNVNDLYLTLDLYNKLDKHGYLSIRKEIGDKYNKDVMSKSDAQLAEVIFREELTKKGVQIKKNKPPKFITYTAPESVYFENKDLNILVDKIEDSKIEIDKGGSPMIPKWLKDELIQIGDTTYNIGLGGLHSQEKSMVVIPKDNETLQNVDVASYYPSLILDLKLYPEQLTKDFLKVYQNIKDTRLKAKANKSNKSLSDKQRAEAKSTDAVLKIALNGSFGKYGSKYSFLYSPDLLLTVTLTGQLYLLMLIEALENEGFKVVSSNTDGVEVVRKKDKKSEELLKEIVTWWESITNMVMEYGQYNALFARDVNNYVAVYPNGIAKAKGAYTDPEVQIPILSKNVEYPVVFEAIREYLSKNTPMEDTIYNCEDIAKFTSSRAVTGGAISYDGSVQDTDEYITYLDERESKNRKQNKALEKRNDTYHKEQVLKHPDTKYLGKVVRWYYSIDGKPIFYKKSGNKVPKSDGAKPMMDLTDHIPKDLDYDKYIQLCYEHLADLGVNV